MTTAAPTSMRRLTLREVCERTNVSRRTVFRRLAEDAAAGTPGRSFPAPVDKPIRKRALEWRESELIRWLEEQEEPKQSSRASHIPLQELLDNFVFSHPRKKT